MIEGGSAIDAKFWLMLLNVSAFIVTWFITWMTAKSRARESVVAELIVEVARLRERLDSAPPAQLVHELSATLRAVQSAFKSMSQRIDGMQHSVDRVNDYLLNKKD